MAIIGSGRPADRTGPTRALGSSITAILVLMTIHGDYRGDHVCAISGATTNLACCTLIQYDVLERKEADVSCCQCM